MGQGKKVTEKRGFIRGKQKTSEGKNWDEFGIIRRKTVSAFKGGESKRKKTD